MPLQGKILTLPNFFSRLLCHVPDIHYLCSRLGTIILVSYTNNLTHYD